MDEALLDRARLLNNAFIKPILKSYVPELSGVPARAMVLAIWIQESRLAHRRQIVRPATARSPAHRGPARSWGQFEEIGVREVRRVAPAIWKMLVAEGMPDDPKKAHVFLETSELAAVLFTRGLLLRDRRSLPTSVEEEETGWSQYVENWKPRDGAGKERWNEAWTTAWMAQS